MRVSVGADEVFFAGATTLAALSRTDGAVKWRYARRPAPPSAISPAALSGKSVFFGYGSTVAALAPHTGRIQWKAHADGWFAPVVTPTTVYVRGTDNRDLVALDAGNGVELWRQHFDGPITSPPLIDNATLYVVAGDVLYAIEGSDHAAVK
jgi:outer membrane protein assembly factor BamB